MNFEFMTIGTPLPPCMPFPRALTGKQINRIPFSSSCPLDSIASSIRQYMTFAVLLTGNPVNALERAYRAAMGCLSS